MTQTVEHPADLKSLTEAVYAAEELRQQAQAEHDALPLPDENDRHTWISRIQARDQHNHVVWDAQDAVDRAKMALAEFILETTQGCHYTLLKADHAVVGNDIVFALAETVALEAMTAVINTQKNLAQGDEPWEPNGTVGGAQVSMQWDADGRCRRVRYSLGFDFTF